MCLTFQAMTANYSQHIPGDKLTLGQAADSFGISRHVLKNLVRKNLLRTYKSVADGRVTLVDRAEVEQRLEEVTTPK